MRRWAVKRQCDNESPELQAREMDEKLRRRGGLGPEDVKEEKIARAIQGESSVL